MYRLVLACRGVPTQQGEVAARCITAEFANRPWHDEAVCAWDGECLVLSVRNDFDVSASATRDEFSDTICACVKGGFDGDLVIQSVTHEG